MRLLPPASARSCSPVPDRHLLLEPAGFDGLFQHHAVRQVRWEVVRADTRIPVTGSGEYRIGGEFARQHRLTLDVQVGAHPPQRFDSGLAVGGRGSAVEIDVAVHGFFCFDTVMRVRAEPPTAAAEAGPGARLEVVASPGPFRDRTEVRLMLPTRGAVDLGVFDARGRLVRTLAAGRWLEAGAHRFAWDGRGQGGRAAAAGIYALRLRTAAGEVVRAVALVR